MESGTNIVGANSGGLRSARVLVVDDDEFIREGLGDLLSKDGYLVNKAPDGEVALDMVLKDQYDIVITDLKMPGMDGIELLRRIRGSKPNLPVILITAYATVDAAVRAMQDGAADFIRKPFDITEIKRVVRINTLDVTRYAEREDLVDNDIRDRIFKHISGNPGVHFRQIQSDLAIGNGTLDYHLHILEKKALVKKRKDGIFQRYYLVSARMPDENSVRLSDIQSRIMKAIEEGNGISQSSIAENLQMSRQLVNYHIKIMERKGLLELVKTGGLCKCYVARPGNATIVAR